MFSHNQLNLTQHLCEYEKSRIQFHSLRKEKFSHSPNIFIIISQFFRTRSPESGPLEDEAWATWKTHAIYSKFDVGQDTDGQSRTSDRWGSDNWVNCPCESTNLIKNPRTKIRVNFFDCVAGLLLRNSSMGTETNGNRCVQCGFRTSQLFVLYSPGNMHLMKCVSLLQQNFFLTCPFMRSFNHFFSCI